MDEKISDNDHRSRRCPMLGHPVEFSYCRAPGAPLPCRKIFDCWWETFDVKEFIRNHYGDEKIAAILSPPRDKVVSLTEIIERARKRK